MLTLSSVVQSDIVLTLSSVVQSDIVLTLSSVVQRDRVTTLYRLQSHVVQCKMVSLAMKPVPPAVIRTHKQANK